MQVDVKDSLTSFAVGIEDCPVAFFGNAALLRDRRGSTGQFSYQLIVIPVRAH